MKLSRRARLVLVIMVLSGLFLLFASLLNKGWESTKDIPGLLGVSNSTGGK